VAGAGAGRSRVHQGLEERWQERCRVRGARGLRSPSPGMQARIGSYGREGVGWGAGLGQRPALCRMPRAACRVPHAACASCVPLQSLTHITCAGPLHGNPGVFSECGATAFARPLCPLVSPGGDVCVCSGGCECAWRMRVRVCVACEDASMRRGAVLVRTCLGRRVCVWM